MLEETGVEYEIERIDLRDSGRQDDADFRAASPMRKVPALKEEEPPQGLHFQVSNGIYIPLLLTPLGIRAGTLF